jgi:Mg-chelatase subunit ChlD
MLKSKTRIYAHVCFSSLLVTSAILASCGTSNFSSKKSAGNLNQKQTPVSPGALSEDSKAAGLISISCEEELNTGRKTLLKKDSPLGVQVSDSCSRSQVKTSTREVKEKLDIVFVLDITGSMNDNLDAVKSTVVEFTEQLSEKGWDAQFAAVGFRDRVEEQTNFVSASSLATELEEWEADGGFDVQEAGQDGLRSAISLSKKSGRVGAKKVFLLVTDAPFYANSSNHTDFSVSLLSKTLKTELPDAVVYCSAPKYDERSDDDFVAPVQQCTDLRAQSEVKGSNLPFPLSANVLLNQFSAKLEELKTEQSDICKLTSLSFVSTSGSVSALSAQSASPKPNQFWFKSDQTLEQFLGAHTLRVERCCASQILNLDSKACSQPLVSQVTLTLE